MASHPNRHAVPPASNVSCHKCKQTSSSTTRHPIPPTSNLSHPKVKRNSSSFSSSTTTYPPAAPASNFSHRKGKQTSFSTATCPLAAPTSNLSHQKGKQTSSSSSTTTCPSAAPPSYSSMDHPGIKYDVFLSFKGTDTRSSFLSHLLEGLAGKNIDYFVDDKKLKQGDEISSTLLNAIKKSAISLVLFSKDYAYSRWCLEELEQILQCRENQNQIIVPIFYKVDPSTVRHQKESYNKAFDKLGKRFDKCRLQKWQTALKKAADLSGFHSSNYNTEATLIREIVEHVLVELRKMGNQTDLKGFVGIHEYIQYLESRLHIDSKDILTFGIWGMAGVGKTTIAEILYNRLCNKYEGSCLLCVREKLEEGRRIRDLKKNLLSKLLGEVVHDVTLNGNLEYIERRLQRKKVLVVLDDINDLDHLEILTGKHVWFGPGSRIIMTSRDKHVFSKGCTKIYMVQPLNSEYALQLCEICFEKSSIEKQELKELSQWVVNYAKGIPLVIKVLCGYFSGDKSEEERKSKLEKLKKMPDSKIQKVLELSYNGLDDEEHKAIFLYLACFFRRESRERIISLLDKCGYYTIDGLRALQDKALITISKQGLVFMHDLICAMGREIVRKTSSQDPGQRSHLWDVANIYDVLQNQTGTRSIESIRLDIWRLEKDLQLGPQAFAGMNNLRLLQFDDDWPNGSKHGVYPPKEGFESFPKALRCFIWTGYPSRSLPSRFYNENLVELRFRHSKLRRLWSGHQDLPNLKFIDLSCSVELTEVPDLSKAPNLIIVDLQACFKLRRLWPNHNIVELDSTEYEEHKKISIEESNEDDHLDLCGTSLPIKPSYKYYEFSSLQFLYLGFCISFVELPDNIGLCLPSLQTLCLHKTNVKTIPASIKHLSHLTELRINGCNQLRYIPELPPTVENIWVYECRSLETIQFTSNSMPLFYKHRLVIELSGCVRLDDHTLKAVAWYFNFTIQRMISLGIKDGYATLCFTGSKIPKLFGDRYCGVTHDSRSLALVLPLHSEVMGFFFFLFLFEERKGVLDFHFDVECHIAYLSDIELRNNAPVLKGHVQFTYYCEPFSIWYPCVSFWYEGSLNLKITEELCRIKALAATTDDLRALVWFEFVERKSECLLNIKEWALYSNCAMGFHDIRFL